MRNTNLTTLLASLTLASLTSLSACEYYGDEYSEIDCGSDSDCSAIGLECMEDVLGSAPAGICADVRDVGDTCETSIWTADISSDEICTGSGVDDIIDCFSSRCEEVCNWTGRTGAPIQCNSGSCGALQFRAEAGTSVAVCQ